MPTCFFIGHRVAPETLLPQLFDEIERHITEYGVTDFVAGGYGRFDTLAAQSVKAAKKCHSADFMLLTGNFLYFSLSS